MAKHSSKLPTSFDVAKAAGVSQTTVSRVYNNKWSGKVSREARDKVLKAAAELGYSKNEIAKGLSMRRTGIVGIIKSRRFNVFYDQILSCLIDFFAQQGINTMVFNSEVSSDINEVLLSAASYQLDGIIITSATLTHEISTRVIERDIPIVLLNCSSENTGCSRIYSDNYGGSALMASFLYQNGFRRFAYVSSDLSIHQNHRERQEGFLSRLSEFADVDEVQIAAGDYSYESGIDAAHILLSCKKRAEVIFCANERMALGVIDAAQNEFRLSVPEDISVAGFEDSATAGYLSYSLTALQQQPELLARRAAETLLRCINTEQANPEIIHVPQKLVVRGSVKLKPLK